MHDIVVRTPRLSFIDLREVVVFGRFGRSDADGAFATCHCLTLPESEPGYYFWRDRSTGQLTRRSEWFVTKSPEVRVGGTRVKYLVSFVLPRFCDQSLERSRKADLYSTDAPSWLAKLDTIVHELYHIDPDESGIRRVSRSDGSDSPRSHGPLFYEEVAEMVKGYLASGAGSLGLRVSAGRFCRAHVPIRGCSGDNVQEFPVLSSAIHGSRRHARGGPIREGGTAQTTDAARAVYGRRSPHAPLHRRGRAQAAARRASTGRHDATARGGASRTPRRPVARPEPLDP